VPHHAIKQRKLAAAQEQFRCTLVLLSLGIQLASLQDQGNAGRQK
jgi:hypothetical protein